MIQIFNLLTTSIVRKLRTTSPIELTFAAVTSCELRPNRKEFLARILCHSKRLLPRRAATLSIMLQLTSLVLHLQQRNY